MFSGGIERDQWYEMVKVTLHKNYFYLEHLPNRKFSWWQFLCLMKCSEQLLQLCLHSKNLKVDFETSAQRYSGNMIFL